LFGTYPSSQFSTGEAPTWGEAIQTGTPDNLKSAVQDVLWSVILW